ncbi:MAG: GNAT family N-acetyltransferase [Phycisphaerales bacterium]|nr:MAG: GNAT family N-acetyltransferase [Phycisphaerales bacterium]
MTQEVITVRSATFDDLDTIAAFNQAMALETENKTLDPHVATAGVKAGLTDPGKCMFFVAEVAGTVAGQAMITTEWSDWHNGFFWWIQSVYVEIAYRRRGVFRKLYDYIHDMARGRHDVCGLRLYVHRDNKQALNAYREIGMTLTDYLLCEEEWAAGS